MATETGLLMLGLPKWIGNEMIDVMVSLRVHCLVNAGSNLCQHQGLLDKNRSTFNLDQVQMQKKLCGAVCW